MLVEGAFRRLLNSNIALKTFEDRLVGAVTPDECWEVIQDSATDFGFHTIEMSLAGRSYQYRNGGSRTAPGRFGSRCRPPISSS